MGYDSNQSVSSVNGARRDDGEDRDALLSIREYLHDNYGIYFPDKKLYSLENKINKRLRYLPVESLREYEVYLKENPDELPFFLDEVSTNKTAFFREPKHWNYLVDEVVPEWEDRSRSRKAWSVACSTGEEPYTLAMLLDDTLSAGGYGFRENPDPAYKILASDISRNVLNSTERGRYSSDRIQQVQNYNARYVEKFFKPKGTKYQIKERLKQRITLRRFNLNTDRYPFENNFDLILCRNVLIYFNRPMIEHVIHQVTRALVPGGYLFIGHTESLQEIDHSLTRIQPAIFRKS